VTCPSDTAYGSRGAGGAIPPVYNFFLIIIFKNADLEFEIEMLGFREHKLEDL
jgi:FK506-binding protein 1